MSDSTRGKNGAAALVVFGQTEKGGRNAAWFTIAESVNANKAAALSSLAVIEPIPDELIPVLPKIARGKFVMGQISLSKADPAAYSTLLRLHSTSKKPEKAEGEAVEEDRQSAPEPSAPNLPAAASTSADPWQRLKIGDAVLGAYDGWWKARIVAVYGDRVRVAWDGGEAGVFDELPRSAVAQLFPEA